MSEPKPMEVPEVMWGVLAIPTLRPLRVAKTVGGSPADAAGVQAGDLIKTVDGHPVTSFADLIEILKTKRPWDSLRATLERDGSSIEVASLLVPRPQRKSPQKLSQPLGSPERTTEAS